MPIVFAQPGTWAGYVKTDGSIAVNGTIVSAINNNVSSTELKTTIGTGAEYGGVAPAGYYAISIEGTSGDSVNFKICGIYVAVVAQSWSAGPHYNGTTPNFNLSVSKLANSVSCTYSCACSGNYCCSGATQYTNGEGTGTCQATVCTAPTTTTTTTTTTTSAAPSAAVEVKKTISTASPTVPAVATIETEKAKDLKVDKVTVEVKEALSNVQVTVKESSIPGGAGVAVAADQGATYKYVEITTNVEAAKLEKVKVNFKVENSWLTSNNIDEDKVALQRYANNQWNKLTTTKTSSDATYVYYEAETSALSVFAITGEKKVAAPAGEKCPTCPSPSAWSTCVNDKQTRTNYRCSESTNYSCVSYTEEQSCKVTVPGAAVGKIPSWVYVIIVSVIAGLGFFYRAKRK
ncbi:MAG: PGF-pre-PGF domain-containing protein [Thaumarchaeota archaeon]|nr:PGF-pre-PGF domain-containing protein [Nitrososphaerota archaeon]